ncbi:hypothetical protein FAM09_00105 [Niastella caeni]|uniref:Uncharacterized protein n=1 Tax=Niastella caeni TaxID=2569763 RepID=A0A4S8I395_9BACT|nr:hypothetical protein [Niastella caeni]THU40552.1 hypothetical protein FAM09_00105 [Niastella caeni]
MKTLLIIFSILTLSCSTTTNTNRQIFIKDIGWRFKVPSNISFNDSSFNKDGTLNESIPENGSSLRLFVSKTEKGFLGAFIWNDTLDAKGWKDYHDKDTEWYFNEIRHLPTMTVLDTKYYTEKVDNIDFLVQQVKFIKKSTSDTGYTYHYFGRLKGKGLDFSFEYYDKELGKSFHNVLTSSRFAN